ncbi:Glyoxalase-like domain protein [Planctopirus ephydatiae]|uniref:Glyoxalase-like domain protein n=1 Tax=Planctopirus ephydatiae TaxID=2528019 RepID=A0A518GM90_9PLAN|nr:VOC family protein [Planctopirus ephydatiae]QDV29684.1 Glyoxalase-like domain protein [Planctopirus ephydatiae]
MAWKMQHLGMARGALCSLFGAMLLSGISIAVAALQEEKSPETAFSSETIDVGLCVSNMQASIDFYTKAIGFQELPGFSVPADYAQEVGLSDGQVLDVKVLTLGTGPTATRLKLIQFPKVPGARVDQSYIQSTYGIRYLTIHVKDVNASLEKLKQHKVKPIASSPKLLPAGFPEGVGLCNLRDPDGNLVELVGPYRP